MHTPERKATHGHRSRHTHSDGTPSRTRPRTSLHQICHRNPLGVIQAGSVEREMRWRQRSICPVGSTRLRLRHVTSLPVPHQSWHAVFYNSGGVVLSDILQTVLRNLEYIYLRGTQLWTKAVVLEAACMGPSPGAAGTGVGVSVTAPCGPRQTLTRRQRTIATRFWIVTCPVSIHEVERSRRELYIEPLYMEWSA